MFIRFIPRTEVQDSEYVWSLFGAIAHLQESAHELDVERLDHIYDWFIENLPAPYRLSRSKKVGADSNALCWFKASAYQCIDKLREAVLILEDNDIMVETLTTKRPGYIVYEDNYQIAAVPFRA